MRISLVLLSVLTVSAAVFAQSNYASVSGKVVDAQSLPIAHATVLLTSASNGTTRTVTTDENGIFYAPALLPDDYQLTVSATGFASVVQPLHVEVGQRLAVDVSLKVGPVKEGVAVTAAADILRSTDASVGEVVEPKSIQELPLNGRMLIDLVLTVPGAHAGFGAQTG